MAACLQIESQSTKTSSYNRVKKIQTHTIKSPENVTFYRMRKWCQHPDGSFLYLANIRVSSVDDDEDDSIYTSQRYKLVIIHISSDFEYQCYYNIDIKEDWYTRKHICCTDTGDMVMSVKGELRLYRISSGKLQFIKSTDMEFECENIAFFKNKIYCFTDEESFILDTNLNIKRSVELMEIPTENIVPCSLQKYIGIFETDFGDSGIICEDSRLKQLKYLRKEGFLPMCICAATGDSVFVFGEQDEDCKILQVNTDMTVLSEICINDTKCKQIVQWDERKMVFDKNNSRLVISSGCWDDVTFQTIYLA